MSGLRADRFSQDVLYEELLVWRRRWIGAWRYDGSTMEDHGYRYRPFVSSDFVPDFVPKPPNIGRRGHWPQDIRPLIHRFCQKYRSSIFPLHMSSTEDGWTPDGRRMDAGYMVPHKRRIGERTVRKRLRPETDRGPEDPRDPRL